MTAGATRKDLVRAAERQQKTVVDLQNRAVKDLGKDVNDIFDESATALGLLENGELLADSPIEIAVIADHAVYDIRRDGRNAIERLQADHPPAEGSREAEVLAAMTEARCSAYKVTSVETDVGIAVTDVYGGPSRFVVEPELSEIASDGVVFIGRLVTLEDVTVTTGTSLPLDEVSEADIRDAVGEAFPGRNLDALTDLSPDETIRFNAILWNAALDATDWAIEALVQGLLAEAVTGDDEDDAGSGLWLPPDPFAPEPAPPRKPPGSGLKHASPRKKVKRKR